MVMYARDNNGNGDGDDDDDGDDGAVTHDACGGVQCDCGDHDVDVDGDDGCDYSGDHAGNDHNCFLSEGLQFCHCAHIATFIFGLLGRLRFDNLIKVTDWFKGQSVILIRLIKRTLPPSFQKYAKKRGKRRKSPGAQKNQIQKFSK